MTDEQRLALEAIVGRELTGEERITISGLWLSSRNDVEIAALLSRGRVKTKSTPIGIGTCLAVMAPLGGNFLNTLEEIGATDANVKWALKMIEQGTFDVGHPVTRAQLAAFAATTLSMADSVGALMAVAEVADPIHYNIISDALNIAEGRMTP